MTSAMIEPLTLFTEAGLSTLFEQTGKPQCIIYADQIVSCNRAAIKLNPSCLLNGLKPISITDVLPHCQPDGSGSATNLRAKLAICHKLGEHNFNWVYQTRSGRLKWLAVTLSKRQHEHLELIHVGLQLLEQAGQNIEQLALDYIETSSSDFNNYVLLNEYKRAIDQSSIVSKADRNGIITYVNDKFVQVSGFSQQELVGQPHSIINHPDTPKSLFKELWQTINAGKVWKGIIKNKKKNGESYYVDSTISPIIDAQGQITEFIAIRNDVTELYQQEKLIVYQNTDEATGLPNRTKLDFDLAELVQTRSDISI